MNRVIREMQPGELEQMMAQELMDRGLYALESHQIEALERYVKDRIEPGSFLMAVLSNNLKEACGRADMYNRRRIFEYCEWLYNKAPSACWGSPERVEAWLSKTHS